MELTETPQYLVFLHNFGKEAWMYAEFCNAEGDYVAVMDADIVDGSCDFRMMKREMVEAIIAISESNRFSKGIFGWVRFRTYWLSYENVERIAEEIKWNSWKLFRYAIDVILNLHRHR